MIVVENLTRTYNIVEENHLKMRQQLYAGFNMNIKAGEFVAIVGDSGCGKSTLLNIIGMLDSLQDRRHVRILDPKTQKEINIPQVEGSGNIFIDEQNITELYGNARSDYLNKNIGFIFQFHHLIPELTALQNVALPLQINGKSKKEAYKRAKTLLEEMDLEDYSSKLPAVLSGGEKQRVAIARALANSPKLLLADEPTGSLHPKFKSDILDLFLRLNKDKNITILMVTHDVNSLYGEQDNLKVDRILSLDKSSAIGEQNAC
ncbi:MAG: ABC transporter ATP-binding protein [Candidatus Electrothrix sp. AS4_5]|nr:ABC transporter ATP-binding protein [Candidatus Electrothrix gigas]